MIVCVPSVLLPDSSRQKLPRENTNGVHGDDFCYNFEMLQQQILSAPDDGSVICSNLPFLQTLKCVLLFKELILMLCKERKRRMNKWHSEMTGMMREGNMMMMMMMMMMAMTVFYIIRKGEWEWLMIEGTKRNIYFACTRDMKEERMYTERGTFPSALLPERTRTWFRHLLHTFPANRHRSQDGHFHMKDRNGTNSLFCSFIPIQSGSRFENETLSFSQNFRQETSSFLSQGFESWKTSPFQRMHFPPWPVISLVIIMIHLVLLLLSPPFLHAAFFTVKIIVRPCPAPNWDHMW